MTESRNPDNDLVTGHPSQGVDPADPNRQMPNAQPQPAVEPAPAMESVDINGVSYQMTPEAAAATRAQQTSFNEQLSEVYSSMAPVGEIPETDPDTGGDFETLLYTDPNKAFAQFGANLRDEITRELRGEYQAADSRKTWWDGFYQSNDDLSQEHQFVVEAVMKENWKSLEHMPGDAAMGQIADLTRKRIMELTKQPTQGNNNGTDSLEGAGSPAPDRGTSEDKQKQEDKNQPESLSAALRLRREQRAKKTST